MSLISEALKKARQEAARQDAAQRGVPYAVGGGEPAGVRSLAAPLVAGLAAGAVLVGALIVAAYLGHWGPWRGRGEAQVAEAAAATPPVSAEAGSAAVVPAPVAAPPPQASAPTAPAAEPALIPAPPVAPAQQDERRLAPVPAPQPVQTPPPVSRTLPIAPPPPPVASAAPVAAAGVDPAPVSAPPAAPASQEEKLYVRDLPVPGGGTLHLNGVAFSETTPVAVVDGKVVGPGEVVQGFTIVEIQPGRVRLQGHGINVVVTMK